MQWQIWILPNPDLGKLVFIYLQITYDYDWVFHSYLFFTFAFFGNQLYISQAKPIYLIKLIIDPIQTTTHQPQANTIICVI